MVLVYMLTFGVCYGILMVNVTIYIAAPWILWVITKFPSILFLANHRVEDYPGPQVARD